MRERLQVQSLRVVHVIQMQGAYMRIVVRCRIQGYTLLEVQVQRMWHVCSVAASSAAASITLTAAATSCAFSTTAASHALATTATVFYNAAATLKPSTTATTTAQPLPTASCARMQATPRPPKLRRALQIVHTQLLPRAYNGG